MWFGGFGQFLTWIEVFGFGVSQDFLEFVASGCIFCSKCGVLMHFGGVCHFAFVFCLVAVGIWHLMLSGFGGFL